MQIYTHNDCSRNWVPILAGVEILWEEESFQFGFKRWQGWAEYKVLWEWIPNVGSKARESVPNLVNAVYIFSQSVIHSYINVSMLYTCTELHYICEQVLFVRFYNNPTPLNGSMQFHYCTLVTREPEQTTLFVLKRGVWHNATWPSHSRLAIAAGARLFQICFSPLTFWPLVYLPTLCLLSPFYAPSHE